MRAVIKRLPVRKVLEYMTLCELFHQHTDLNDGGSNEDAPWFLFSGKQSVNIYSMSSVKISNREDE